jgi:hypothetical protein
MINFSFAIWISLSVALLVLFLYAAFMNMRRRNVPEVGLDEILPLLQPVNLEALCQIAELSRDSSLALDQETRKNQRRQIRETAACLRRMNHNAALLQRIGYAQLRSPNAMLVVQAQELIDAGVHVRLYTFLGITTLFFSGLFKSSILHARATRTRKFLSSMLLPSYQSLKDKAETLTSFRNTSLRQALLESL